MLKTLLISILLATPAFASEELSSLELYESFTSPVVQITYLNDSGIPMMGTKITEKWNSVTLCYRIAPSEKYLQAIYACFKEIDEQDPEAHYNSLNAKPQTFTYSNSNGERILEKYTFRDKKSGDVMCRQTVMIAQDDFYIYSCYKRIN